MKRLLIITIGISIFISLSAIAYYFVIFIPKKAKLEQQNSNQTPKQILTTISLNQISITGKRVVTKYYGASHNSSQNVALSVIVKNNSDIGIPTVNIKKVTMYDGSHKPVATKTNFEDGSFPLVSQGEFPFSLNFLFEKPEQIDVKDFDLELEIPPFKQNNRLVRLKTTIPIRVSTETIDMYPQKAKAFNFEYKLTLINDTDKTVNNIYRISFLKYKDFTLTRRGEACCLQVKFINENGQDSQVKSLDKATYSYSLNPKESKRYNFKISTDPVLIDDLIDPTNIELITYFIGTTK